MGKGDEGLRFSFGLKCKQQLLSARSTPKFPSIELTKQPKNYHEPKPFSKGFTDKIDISRSEPTFYRQLGGGGIDLIAHRHRKNQPKSKQAVSPFLLQDNSSVDNFQSKSIKSTQSATTRVNALEKKHFRNRDKLRQKSAYSLSNIFDLKKRNNFSKRVSDKLDHHKVLGSKVKYLKTQEQFQRQMTVGIRDGEEPTRKQTKKIVNNFFQTEPQNMSFRQTKKDQKNQEKHRLVLFEKEKGRNMKQLLQKARPVLRIGGRLLTNQKIQKIASVCENDQ